jgi:hypothetical protein
VKRSTRNLVLLVVAGVVLAELLDSSGNVVARRKLTKGELVKLARDTGFPDADFAASIALRESGGDPMALNDHPPREVSVGLWQINTLVHHKFSREQLTDPKVNARYAFEISKGGTDWSPWSTAGKQVTKTPPAPSEPEVTPGPPIDPGEPMPDGDDGGGVDF